MDVNFNGKVVSFGEKARMKWERFGVTSDRLVVYLRHGVKMEFRIADFPGDVLHLALLHGLKQKLGDECASNAFSEDDEDSLRKMRQRLINADWFAKERESSGGMLAEAIFRVMGGDKAKIAEKLKAMSAKDKAALESNPRIKAAMDAIREEKGKGVAPIEDDALESMFK